ncbi:hypothetical protein MYX04_09770 [Nitrospiraceae bacterium AH_259_D15_M11_P09]|nr:hypothetical protein [Nitrospiraceae bacterium AH_259_D15_M11_P09]
MRNQQSMDTSQAQRPGRLTGERLGNKVELAQALLNSGVSKSKVAGDLKISRHSVRAIARRMEGEGLRNHARVESVEQYFKGKLTRVADMNLEAITPGKVKHAPLASNIQAADKALGRLLELEGRAQPRGVGDILRELGFVLSSSVSCVKITTVEQAEIIEATASNGPDPGAEEAKQAGLDGVVMD